MSISRTAKRSRPAASNRDAGFTITEALITLAIGAVLVLFVGTLLQRSASVRTYATSRLLDEIDSNLGLRMLIGQLNRSQILQTRLLTCSGLSAAFADAQDFELDKTDGGSFSIVSESGSALASPHPTQASSLILTEPGRFLPGSLIAVINVAKPEMAGVFTVTAMNASTGIVQVAPAAVDAQTGCEIGAKSQSWSSLTAGSDRPVFVVQKLQIGKYSVAPEPQRPGKSSLVVQMYPAQGEPPRQAVIPGFESLKVDNEWTKYAANDETGDVRSGRMVSDIVVDFYPPVRQGQQEPKDPRRVASQASYELTPVLRLNKDVQTQAIPSTELYPTCSVTAAPQDATPIPPGLSPTDPILEQGRPYLITGSVSENLIGTSLVVRIIPSGGDAKCVLYDPPPKPWENRFPFTGAFEIHADPSLPSDMQAFVCIVKGKVGFTSTMKYFDPKLKRQMTLDCTGASASAPSEYRFLDGEQPSCSRTGDVYNIPLIVENVPDNPRTGPVLNAAACHWQKSPTETEVVKDPEDSSKAYTSCVRPQGAAAPEAVLVSMDVQPQLIIEGEKFHEIVCN